MKIKHFKVGDNIWFQGNEVTRYLEYQDYYEAIYSLVDANTQDDL